jgi:thiol-disulfide isomerase/thioredoxin
MSKTLKHASNTSKDKKNTVVCKIYANWCGHCKDLEPVWAELKNLLEPNKSIEMIEIEESEMKKKLGELKNICKQDINVAGFPTIVKICNKKVEYYQGERTLEAMRNWIQGSKTGGRSKKRKTRKHNRRA